MLPLLRIAACLAAAYGAVAQAPTWSFWNPPAPTAPGVAFFTISDVAATSPTDAWAVGSYSTATEVRTYVAHFDGTAWTQVAAPDPAGTGVFRQNYVNAVLALAPNDVWIAGSKIGLPFLGGPVGPIPFVAHFDGATWAENDPPALYGGSGSYVDDIVASGPNDVWFAGYWVGPGYDQSLGWRWNGGSWSFPTTPLVTPTYGGAFADAFAAGPGDVFAVGGGPAPVPPSVISYQNVARYSGSAWAMNLPPAAAPGTNYLWTTVDGTGPNDVWIGGITEVGVPPTTTVHVKQWNGANWAVKPAPPFSYGGLSDLAVFGPANVYAAGYGGVYAFNGTSWTLEQDFTAFGAVPNAGGVPCWAKVVAKQGADLWVCGSQFLAGGGFAPFVARRGVPPAPPPLPTATTVARPFCAAMPAAFTLAAVAPPQLGGAAIVASYDVTAAGAALSPANTYSYWVGSFAAPVAHPCGDLAPGFGAGAQPAEVMVGLVPGLWFTLDGPQPWTGPGSAAIHAFPIPALPFLAGWHVHTQALVVDFTTPPFDFVLTDGLELVLGV